MLAILAVQLRGRRLEQIVRRARAAEWFGVDTGDKDPLDGAGQNGG
ncbi:hypothetical protein [Brachybacterium sacelli]|uniref:Uncharacterized protein n=1 Tax=Brachybacterium sacelli TaxID=173364 RepID=A0ABS4X1H5_9MICO|nr:hypothetical protein [Brachybacterium sacelli]MBP2382231.1 hypothetical protein [Brachybacterium sacelli]